MFFDITPEKKAKMRSELLEAYTKWLLVQKARDYLRTVGADLSHLVPREYSGYSLEALLAENNKLATTIQSLRHHFSPLEEREIEAEGKAASEYPNVRAASSFNG